MDLEYLFLLPSTTQPDFPAYVLFIDKAIFSSEDVVNIIKTIFGSIRIQELRGRMQRNDGSA